MTRKLFLFAAISTAVQLSAGAGIASDNSALPAIREKAPESREQVLALFINALLEKDPEKRCSALISVIEKDLNNAEAPLQAFRVSVKNLKKPDKIIEKFNALWKRYPTDISLSLHGSALNRSSNTPAARRLEQLTGFLQTAPGKIINDPRWKQENAFFILPLAADLMLQNGKYEDLLSLFKSWSTLPAPYRTIACALLADYCYTAGARSYAAGAESRGKALEMCLNTAWEVIQKEEATVTDRKTADAILFFHLKFRPLDKNRAINFARSYDKRIRSTESNLWLLTTAIECGSINDFNKAVGMISEINPRFDSTEFRFKLLLNAENFEEAEKTLEKLPAKQHFASLCLLYTLKKDWKGLYAFLDNALRSGTPADYTVGHMMLSIAEQTGDPAIFRRAEKILAPHQKHPGIANASGYVAAVLGLDLPEARKRLTYALSKEPLNSAYLDSMAWIAFKQKRYAEAEKFIRKALENITSPREGVATIFEHAGDIAAAQGKSPLRYYALSLKYAPFELGFDPARVIRKTEAFSK